MDLRVDLSDADNFFVNSDNSYSFDIFKLHAGGWSLMLLKNERVVGGYVGSDSEYDDLEVAGKNWLSANALLHFKCLKE